MKTELCIAAQVAGNAPTLLAIASVLQHHSIRPSSFVWTFSPETEEARVWLDLGGEPSAIEALLEELRAIPGVSDAGAHKRGQAIVNALHGISDPPWPQEPATD